MPNCITQACPAALWPCAMISSTAPALPKASDPGVGLGVIARRVPTIEETVDRLKKDIAAKGIIFFRRSTSRRLPPRPASTRPSILLIFGNPPLGTQFITADPQAGLDWPVRILVYRDTPGTVWTA